MTRFEDKKILIIEDDPDVGNAYKFLLARAGYREIRLAESGDDGLELAKAWRPALIISDILHPGLDGFSIFEELFLNPNTLSTRFIMISGCSLELHPEYSEKLQAVGVSFYREKPINLKDIAKIVEEVFTEVEEETRKGY